VDAKFNHIKQDEMHQHNIIKTATVNANFIHIKQDEMHQHNIIKTATANANLFILNRMRRTKINNETDTVDAKFNYNK